MNEALKKLYGQTAPLLGTGRHSLPLIQSRIELILARVRLTAAILGVLMVAWIPVDMAFLPWNDLVNVAAARVLAAMLFMWLLFYKPSVPSLALARAMLAVLLAIPLVFFSYANISLADAGWTDKTLFIKSAYAHLPHLIALLLCLFPLTALEGTAFGLGILFVAAIDALLPGTPAALMVGHGTVILQAVITAIAVIAGMSQLQFMAGFIRHSTTDQMTGCLRRDYGLRLLQSLFATTQRANMPLCVAFVDLDNFKKVNDTFGHDAGDDVLKEAGRRLQGLLRQQDTVVRWGGEEFVIVMPGLKLADVPTVMHRLGAGGLGPLPDGRVQTASIGAAEYQEDGLKSCDDIISLADKRMYATKQSGRNGITVKAGRFPLVALAA
ncbi:MAG: GGDEF domain-containing protein [Alphaproteobacteria bacterium]|nr:MAG: GGDEF domain-containing protein [Alphaproteobacteria bacterium]